MTMLALARRLTQAHQATRRGSWIWGELYGNIWELSGKTLGLVGLGAIGREVARLAVAFGMTVAYTRRTPEPVSGAAGYRHVDLETLLAESRVVSLHCPLTPETRGLIDSGALRAMREDALLVNTARGDVVVEKDLADALRHGWIAGAAVDVFGSHSDRIDLDSPLLRAPNLLLTPHSAGCTAENLEYTFQRAGIANLVAWIEGRPLTGVVAPVAPLPAESETEGEGGSV